MNQPLHPRPDGRAIELAPGVLIAGKFRLERMIGRGGMGSVWAARHEKLAMPVALKFIEEAADTAEMRVRFEREAKAAAQLRSPHVVQIIDHGVDGETPFIAMELLEGEDLGERLRREGRIPVHAASRILSQAAKAMRRAHEAGIVHRDLKPGNLFLARFDEDEVVKVLDFGVAKLHWTGALGGDAAPTQTGTVFGSPSYMSPEQARGARAIDHRSDLWSLAVILYRAITGTKPFQAGTIGDLVIKLCIDPLPVATRDAPDLPREVDAFFDRAFARDPDQRFQSAVEMATAFEAVAMHAGPMWALPPRPSVPGGGTPSRGLSSRGPAASLPSIPMRQLTESALSGLPAPVIPPVGALPPPPPLSSRGAGAAPVDVDDAQPTTAYSIPEPLPASLPVTSGSGPHVAFAAGTLTPPPSIPGAVPSQPTASGAQYPRVAPPPVAPPIFANVEEMTGAHTILAKKAAARSGQSRGLLIVVAAATAAVAVLVVGLLVFARSPSGDPTKAAAPSATVTATAASAAAPAPPAPSVAPVEATASAAAQASPTAGAEAPASAAPAMSAAPEAEPTAAPSAKGPSPKPIKGGKKRRPNFGY